MSGYSAWLFPLYLEHELGADMMSGTWIQLQGHATAADAINTAIGGWNQHFPTFSTYNLNEPPVDRYADWDNIDSQAAPMLDTALATNESLELPSPGIASLAYHVYRLAVPSDVRLVEFRNSWHELENIHVEVLLGNEGALGEPKDWTDVLMERVDDPAFPLPPGSFEFRPTEGQFSWSGQVTYDIEQPGEPPIHMECDIQEVTATISPADGFVAVVPEGAPGITGPGYSGMGTTSVGDASYTCDDGMPPQTVDPEHATWFASGGDYFVFGPGGAVEGEASGSETLGIAEAEWTSEWHFSLPE